MVDWIHPAGTTGAVGISPGRLEVRLRNAEAGVSFNSGDIGVLAAGAGATNIPVTLADTRRIGGEDSYFANVLSPKTTGQAHLAAPFALYVGTDPLPTGSTGKWILYGVDNALLDGNTVDPGRAGWWDSDTFARQMSLKTPTAGNFVRYIAIALDGDGVDPGTPTRWPVWFNGLGFGSIRKK